MSKHTCDVIGEIYYIYSVTEFEIWTLFVFVEEPVGNGGVQRHARQHMNSCYLEETSCLDFHSSPYAE